MALETIEHIRQINGNRVIHHTDIGEECLHKEVPILVNHVDNIISFKIQKGAIKDAGKNGCQVDEMISAALLIIKGLNAKFPDENNVKAMTCLFKASAWLQQRRNERFNRGVEGYEKL